MLKTKALEHLARELASALGSMGLVGGHFGTSELVEKSSKDAERLFQGYAKAKPSKEDAYAAAREFVRGRPLTAWQRDLVSSALAEPIREQGGATALGHKLFRDLLVDYEDEAKRGDLWRLTWHGLLYSYFSYELVLGKDEAAQQGWKELRTFLERTWPLVDREAGTAIVPEWIEVLRREQGVLSAKPVEKYARGYLAGETEPVERLAADLGIPPSSWFWHALVLEVVRRATAEDDKDFIELLPRLLKLIESRPAFRDEAVEHILTRYHACKNAPPDERLRDYVVNPTVWKNPKLKAAGIATAWNRVPDRVWMMVLGWVNERNLKDFFDILAARNQADEGRLAFWSKYMKQITWTRLVFSAETMNLKKHNPAIRNLIAREEGAYAELTAKKDVDAFMMQIGGYIIIEFSRKPNACYVYKATELPFDRFKHHYAGGTDDLALGFYGRCAVRIIHTPGWDRRAGDELLALGIVPDRQDVHRVVASASKAAKAAPPVVQGNLPLGEATKVKASQKFESGELDLSRAPKTAKFSMRELERLVAPFKGAVIKDSRRASGGRLWIEDPILYAALGSHLKALGFKWSVRRNAYYYPEQ